MARSSAADSSSPLVDRHANDTDSSEDEDDVQERAATTRNPSPSAAQPMPTEADFHSVNDDEDLERGEHERGSVGEEQGGWSFWQRLFGRRQEDANATNANARSGQGFVDRTR